MAEIIFDALDPNTACLTPPPATSQEGDACQVEASFHLLGGEISPNDFAVRFKRNQDKFILDARAEQGTLIALLKSYGFSDSNDKLQSALFYSVGFDQWLKTKYPSFTAKHNYQGPSLLPLAGRMRNFIVTGDVESRDTRQTEAAASLLKDILKNPKEGRMYFRLLLESLTSEEVEKSNKAFVHPALRPRIQWLADLLKVFENLEDLFSKIPDVIEQDALRDKVLSLIVFLASGKGDYPKLRKELEFFSIKFRMQNDLPPEIKALAHHIGAKLRSIERSSLFNAADPAFKRLQKILFDLNLMQGPFSPPPLPPLSASKNTKDKNLKIILPLTLGLAAATALSLGLGLGLGLKPVQAVDPEGKNPVSGFGP